MTYNLNTILYNKTNEFITFYLTNYPDVEYNNCQYSNFNKKILRLETIQIFKNTMITLVKIKVLSLLCLISQAMKRLMSYIPSAIYDTVVSSQLTNYSYERLVRVIDRHPLPNNRPLRILDIGVGTAVPLHHVWEQLPKNVEILGVDIDHSYVLKAQRLFKNIIKNSGSRKVDLREQDFYEMSSTSDGKFDLIVFSSSFMLMPYRLRALELAKTLLNENGRIIFILTLQPAQKKKAYFSKLIEYWKPKMKYLITIDFGEITYEDDFELLLREARLKTVFKERLQKQNNIATKLFRVFLIETQL